MKRRRKIILTIAIGLVIGLVLCELVVRVFWNLQIIRMDNLGVISYEFMRETSDPNVPFELKPNLDRTFAHYHIVTNTDGFRDREYPVKKPDNVTRILVLGDSITFGYSTKENRDVYHSLLEEELNNYAKNSNLNRRFEVIGIAAPGYNTYIEKSILKKKGLKYNPDLIIFAYCLNDTRDALYSCEYATDLRLGCARSSLIKMPSSLRRFLRRSVFYSYLAHSANLFVSNLQARIESQGLRREEKKVDNDVEKEPAAKKEGNTKEPEEPKLYLSEGSEWLAIYRNSHSAADLELFERFVLEDLDRMAGKHDFGVIFVIFPAFEKAATHFPEGETYVLDDVHRSLRDSFEKYGFYVLDLKDKLRGRKFDEVAMDDCHLSLGGHRLVSEAIFNYVKENFIDKSG